MYQKIIIAQNIKELRFISSTVKGNFFCLPLNLKTQLYCENNHLPFVDLIDYTVGVPFAIVNIIGGLLGSTYALRYGTKLLRPLFLIISFFLISKIGYDILVL